MPRISIELPDRFPFTTRMEVRITDINYGGHAGNDAILGIIHEARLRYLESLGYTELDCSGAGLIMSDVAIQFKSELYRGDILLIHVAAGSFSRAGFELYYKLEHEKDGKSILAVIAKTGMVCFDYQQRKIMPLPEDARRKMTSSES